MQKPSLEYQFYQNCLKEEVRAGFPIGLLGISMGGYAALLEYLRSPQLYFGVSVLSPALLCVSPFQDVAPLSPDPARSDMLSGLFRATFQTSDQFEKNNPLKLLSTTVLPKNARLAIEVGGNDEFGFQNGARVFCEIGSQHQIPVEFAVVPGFHHDLVYARARISQAFEKLLV